jgi:Holliday junction DNA helicase RuvB
MLQSNRLVDGIKIEDEIGEGHLRPQKLQDFIGQTQLKKNLSVFINAAKSRKESLDHVLFYGPPGLGKTTLSQIISRELGVGFKSTSGPILSKAGDLAAILTNLQENDVLFIDEIHRLPTAVEEMLYPAMEDFTIDLIIGEGPAARTVKINLPKFTLVGATTRLGLLSNPLRDRFGIPLKLDFYQVHELQKVVERGSGILNVQIIEEASHEIARCARGTPRVAIRLLRRVRDFAELKTSNNIDHTFVKESLTALGVDANGLDAFDHKYLRFIAENYAGGPVGVETIAAALAEDKNTIEDTIEPYLMQIGFLARTPRGRVLTTNAVKYLNIPLPKINQEIFSLDITEEGIEE